jgi:hypothetical protein
MGLFPRFLKSKDITDEINKTFEGIETSAKTLSVDYLKRFSSDANDSDYFIVTSNTDWQVVLSPTWCTITPNYGTGNANVTVQVSENVGGERTGLIVLIGKDVIGSVILPVIQLSDVTPASTLIAGSISDFVAAGEIKTLTITSNTAWSVISYPAWVSLVNPSSGFGNGSIQITANPNSSGQRTGNIVIRGTGLTSDVVVPILQVSGVVASANYYVAPNGSDSNPGTLAQPFYSLNKLNTVISAGQTAYLRGGTYSYTTQQSISNKSGSAGNLIKIYNYPGETPIITRGAGYTAGDGVLFDNNDYIHIKGIEVTGFTQLDTSSLYIGFWVTNCTHCTFEQFNYHHNGGPMMFHYVNDQNLILNSDFHHNFDPLTGYGNADGCNPEFTIGTSNKFYGCRFWNNGDDGLDIFRSDGYVEVDNCWSWKNGYREDGTTTGGDGNGFKLGRTNTNLSTTKLRLIHNNLSFENRVCGFTDSEANCQMDIFNNTGYKNKIHSFEFFEYNIPFAVRNNIAHADLSGPISNRYPLNDDHNTWDTAITLNDDDFISLDTTGIDGPRQADGSLPILNFLKLRPTSDLVGAGVDLGYGLNIGAY